MSVEHRLFVRASVNVAVYLLTNTDSASTSPENVDFDSESCSCAPRH